MERSLYPLALWFVGDYNEICVESVGFDTASNNFRRCHDNYQDVALVGVVAINTFIRRNK